MADNAQKEEMPEAAAEAGGEQPEQLLAGLKIAVQDKDREIEGLKTSLEDSRGDMGALSRRLEEAVQGYRRLVLKANPELPEELISGDSIEEIEASLKKARDIAGRIKKGLEEAAERGRIPTGAPVRTDESGAGLSAREKIQYAIGGKQ